MTDKVIEHIFQRFDVLETQRQNYEPVWDDITQFVLPHRGDFNMTRARGETRTRRLYDTTAIQANEFLSSTLHGGLTSPAIKWFTLRMKDVAIGAIEPVKVFLEAATNRIFDIFNSPTSNFQSQNHELFLDLAGYGTTSIYIDSFLGEGIRFKTVHLSELFISENKHGMVDTVFRKFKLSARQAAQFWGIEKLSRKIREAAKEKPDERFDFLHCVKANDDWAKDSLKNTKLPFISYHLEVDTKHLLDVRGYHEMPYLVPRWAKLVGEMYGRSPAWSAMADIKMVNTLSKIMVIAAEKQVDPPLLVSDDGVMMPLRTAPGGINFVQFDLQGRAPIQPLQTNARLDIGQDMMEDRRRSIRNAYFVDPLINTPIKSNVTREEILQRQDEKLRLIGPQIGRIQAEYLSPLIQRVYGLLQRNGQLPELPDDVAELIEQGGLEIEYTAPLIKTQRSQEPAALQRLLTGFGPLIQLNPQLLDNVNQDKAFRESAEITGVPLGVLNSSEEVEEIRQARAEQQQQQQALQVATELAQTAGDLKKSGLLDEE